MTNKQSRRSAIGFSIVGSLLVILLCVFINFYTGCSFPWFVFPAFAVLWWPLGVIFAGKYSMKIFSLVGSILVIAALFITNYLTSWSYPWFLFPAFGVIWWPLSLFFAHTRMSRGYAIIGAVAVLALLVMDNILQTPNCPWVLLTAFPLLMWPVGVWLGRHLLELPVAIALSAAGIAAYVALNIFAFPGFPWSMITAYAILWWPLAVAFAGRGHAMRFSLCGFGLSAAMLIALNAVASPHTVWAIYPMFGMAWWPLAVYYFVYKPKRIILHK